MTKIEELASEMRVWVCKYAEYSIDDEGENCCCWEKDGVCHGDWVNSDTPCNAIEFKLYNPETHKMVEI